MCVEEEGRSTPYRPSAPKSDVCERNCFSPNSHQPAEEHFSHTSQHKIVMAVI